MIDELRALTEASDPLLQWLVIMLAGAIPFVESYFGSTLGIVAGVFAPVAIVAAVLGNIASMLGLVYLAGNVRRVRRSDEKTLSARQLKFKRAFDRYGVAGVSMLGQTILPSQLTAMAMVTLGANRGNVILWQSISIMVWGIGFGLLTMVGVTVLLP
ncbi:MAG: hypothetical protein R6W83_09050 [Cryobacterium sp.]